MQNLNFKISFLTYLFIVFLVILFVLIFMKDIVFESIISQTGGNELENSQKATTETANLLLSLDKITLDIGVLSSAYFQELNELPVYPINTDSLVNFGKANPFLGNFIIVPPSTTTAVGGLIYSNQRGANNGQSLRAVSPTRR